MAAANDLGVRLGFAGGTTLSSIDQVIDELATYVAAGATDLRIGIHAPDDVHARATRDALAHWMA